MYKKSAAVYDAIYTQMKDYRQEAETIDRLIQQHKKTTGNNLLDVACGTAIHIGYLKDKYSIEGVDITPEMLAIARQKHPGINFIQDDMTTFDLGKQYDAVISLFSAIGHTKTVDKMQQAVAQMAKHVKAGGVLIVQPFFTPENWKDGSLHADFVDQPELKIARMNVSKQEGKLGILDLHHMVGTPQGIDEFTEQFELGLFSVQEQADAFKAAGLEVSFDQDGLPGGRGRGLFVGTKPL